MTYYVVPIVEGQTEVRCIERLLHRVWTELLVIPVRLQVLPPSRGRRDALTDPRGFHLAEKVEEAYAKLAQRLGCEPSARGLLLLLLDAEGDCPAELAPRLLQTAKGVRSDADIICVLAKRMFENWIMAGASTLAGVNDLLDPLTVPDQLEDRSGAVWLNEQLRSRNRARKYKKPTDAEPFVRAMNLQEARANCPSFDKLCRKLQVRFVQPPAPETDEGATSSVNENG